MTTFRPGDKVTDVFTGRRGRVVRVDADNGRLTVNLGVYVMTGCASWFDHTRED